MIKEREPILEKLSIVFQVLLTVGCFILAKWMIGEFVHPINGNSRDYNIILFIIITLWILILEQFHLGGGLRLKMYSTVFIEYLTAIIVGNVLLYSIIVILDLDSLSRLVLAAFAVLNLIVLYSYKFVLSASMKFIRRRGMNTRQLLIIADKDSDYFIDRLIETTDWGYRIWAIMTDDEYLKEKYKKDLST